MGSDKIQIYKNIVKQFFKEENSLYSTEYIAHSPITINSNNERINCFIYFLCNSKSDDGVYFYFNHDFSILYLIEKQHIYRSHPPKITDKSRLNNYINVEKFVKLKRK